MWFMSGMTLLLCRLFPTRVCLGASSSKCSVATTVMWPPTPASTAASRWWRLSPILTLETKWHVWLPQVDLVFARELSYYMVTMYVPCTMIVVVSWFAFWIDHKSVNVIISKYWRTVLRVWRNKSKTTFTFCCQAPARVTLGVSTLLALSTTLASIQKSLPPVAYMKVSPVLAVSAICQRIVIRPLMCGRGSACFSCSSPWWSMHSLIMQRGECCPLPPRPNN